MKNVVAAIACFSLALALSAPSLHAQKASPRTQPATVTTSPSPLDAVLADLERVSAATDNDLADMKTEKHRGGWMTAWRFWHRDSPRSPQAEKMAASLQRNLHNAMPGLIQDAQSAGTFSATFKLYNNLSVVCELLDSLVAATKSEGKNDPLANDSVAMGRIRQQMATRIEERAAALDGRGTPPYTWSSSSSRGTNGKVKKIVVDDTIPEKKRVAKKTGSSQQ